MTQAPTPNSTSLVPLSSDDRPECHSRCSNGSFRLPWSSICRRCSCMDSTTSTARRLSSACEAFQLVQADYHDYDPDRSIHIGYCRISVHHACDPEQKSLGIAELDYGAYVYERTHVQSYQESAIRDRQRERRHYIFCRRFLESIRD